MVEHWTAQVEKIAADIAFSERLQVEELQLTVSANNEDMAKWVGRYLYPLTIPSDAASLRDSFSLKCIYADAIVSKTIQEISNTRQKVTPFTGTRHRAMYGWDDENGWHIQVAPTEGLVWFCNPADKTIILVYSSRTIWPSLELATTARAIITQYLHSTGWHLCHAGAVTTEQENLLIVGYSGAGKTTLILSLLQSGASYLANEMLFVKPTKQGLIVIPYAIPIAIGLGTSLQFKSIAQLLNQPYQLLYPPRRVDFEQLAAHSTNELLNLKGKIQILPSELISVFYNTAATNRAFIQKLIIPRVSFEPIAPKSHLLNPSELLEVFSNNILSMTNRRYAAPWLRTGFTFSESCSTELLEKSISKIPGRLFDYHVSLNSANNESGFSHFLKELYG